VDWRGGGAVVAAERLPIWPVLRQLRGQDRLGLGGAASKSLVTGPLRETKVKYRRPHGSEGEELDLEVAMDMIADPVLATRRRRALAGAGAVLVLPGRPATPSTSWRPGGPAWPTAATSRVER
jgi:hypothetical protein